MFTIVGLSYIGDIVEYIFENVFLALDMLVCWLLQILYDMFEIFSGIGDVTYDGDETNLLAVFFSNDTISAIYKMIAAMGFTLIFVFTIAAVIRKTFDIDEKVKASQGEIIRNMFKSMLLIACTNVIIIMAITLTNAITRGITYAFNNADATTKTITFDDTDYATMMRIMNRIGNSSLNASEENKYNINQCYNDIREDMIILQKEGVFKYSYQDYTTSTDSDGNTTYTIADETVPNWQYDLTNIAKCHDLSEDQDLDTYDESLTNALVDCMEDLQAGSFYPLESYTRPSTSLSADDTPVDAIVFLSGTTHAAKNDDYNDNVDILSDELRSDYLQEGGKSIYDTTTVKNDFDISFSSFDHLVIIASAIILAKIFLSLCVNCVARIFNMLLLYLISPLVFATQPLDDGEKSKQWGIAFTIQSFSVIGSVVGIRLLMVCIPIIFSDNLVLFDSDILNILAKIVMLIALAVTVEQSSKIVTGILANNAGMQSIYASDVGEHGSNWIYTGAGVAGKIAYAGAGKLLSLPGRRMVKTQDANGAGNSSNPSNQNALGRSNGGAGTNNQGQNNNAQRQNNNAQGMNGLNQGLDNNQGMEDVNHIPAINEPVNQQHLGVGNGGENGNDVPENLAPGMAGNDNLGNLDNADNADAMPEYLAEGNVGGNGEMNGQIGEGAGNSNGHVGGGIKAPADAQTRQNMVNLFGAGIFGDNKSGVGAVGGVNGGVQTGNAQGQVNQNVVAGNVQGNVGNDGMVVGAQVNGVLGSQANGVLGSQANGVINSQANANQGMMNNASVNGVPVAGVQANNAKLDRVNSIMNNGNNEDNNIDNLRDVNFENIDDFK